MTQTTLPIINLTELATTSVASIVAQNNVSEPTQLESPVIFLTQFHHIQTQLAFGFWFFLVIIAKIGKILYFLNNGVVNNLRHFFAKVFLI